MIYLKAVFFVAFYNFANLHALDFGSSVGFYLFTKENPGNYTQVNNKSIIQHIDSSGKIAFLIHGWLENRLVNYYAKLTEVLLSKNYSSVIQVDWRKLAALEYVTSSLATRTVGKNVAELVVYLNQNGGVDLNKFNLIGHSLGAQVAGFAGQDIFANINLKLGRITGLDPAGPLYFPFPNNQRLSKGDARIVFVIHTDGGIFGYLTPTGAIDAFPNGGIPVQPGCPFKNEGSAIFCSHQRSHALYIDALKRPGTLIGTNCSNYAEFEAKKCQGNHQIDLGADFSESDFGRYYLFTKSQPPYGEGP